MKQITIVGAGLIGRSWAVVFARAGRDVVLYDISRNALKEATRWIEETLSVDQGLGLGDARISITTDLYEAVRDADYIQECASEVAAIKARLFAEMDAHAKPTAILASSTSALLPSEFCADMTGRHRALVVHPVNPPHLVPLVELVPSKWTNPEIVATTREFMEAVNQAPIEVHSEVAGFVLNRLQAALVNEAVQLVSQGVADADDVDRTVRDGLGLRWAFIGPFETMDLNSDEGFGGYSKRYKAMFEELGKSLMVAEPWSDSACAKITATRRGRLALSDIQSRQAWRDQRVAALVKLKQQLQTKTPE